MADGVARVRRVTHARPALVVWAVLYFGARIVLDMVEPEWLKLAVSLAPLPAFAWFLRDFVRYLRALDELEQRIQLEALAIAFPLTLMLIMTLGLVQVATPLSAENWSYRHIWPFLSLFYFAGLTIARRRYQ